MAGIDLAKAQQMLDLWLGAETALATSQSYEITIEGNTRKLTRASLADVSKQVAIWNSRVISLSTRGSGRSRMRVIVN